MSHRVIEEGTQHQPLGVHMHTHVHIEKTIVELTPLMLVSLYIICALASPLLHQQFHFAIQTSLPCLSYPPLLILKRRLDSPRKCYSRH